MKEELLKGLTEEQIAKLKACKTQEEVLALAKEEGIELTNEQLEAVSGGFCSNDIPDCPNCGSNSISRLGVYDGINYTCRKCYYSWTVLNSEKK